MLNLFTSQPKIGKNTSEGERRYVASVLCVVFVTKRNKNLLSFNSYLKEGKKRKKMLILRKLWKYLSLSTGTTRGATASGQVNVLHSIQWFCKFKGPFLKIQSRIMQTERREKLTLVFKSGCLKNYCECYEAKIPCTVTNFYLSSHQYPFNFL